MANTIEDIKKKRAQAAAAQAAIEANNQMWNARAAPTAAPVPIAGTPGGFDATIPNEGPPSPALPAEQAKVNAEFERVRRKQLADTALGYQHATSMGDVVTNAPKAEAYTQLDAYGVPKTLEGQTKMQTQLTGQLPMLDVARPATTDPAQARAANARRRTDLNTGQALPPTPQMGDLSADQSPFRTGRAAQKLGAAQRW